MSEQSLLQQAIAAVRAGRKAEARRLLTQILQADPRHESAWLWMSAVVETDARRVECLQKALTINPDNTAAHRGLAQLRACVNKTLAMSQPDTPSANMVSPHSSQLPTPPLRKAPSLQVETRSDATSTSSPPVASPEPPATASPRQRVKSSVSPPSFPENSLQPVLAKPSVTRQKNLSDSIFCVACGTENTVGTLSCVQCNHPIILPSPDEIKRLIALLQNDSSKEEQLKAIETLGRLKARVAVPQLLKFSRLKGFKRLKETRTSQFALTQTVDISEGVIVCRLCDLPNPLSAKFCHGCGTQISPPSASSQEIEQLIALIENNSEELPIHAIQKLGQLKASAATPVLLSLLKTPPKYVRGRMEELLFALEALVEIEAGNSTIASELAKPFNKYYKLYLFGILIVPFAQAFARLNSADLAMKALKLLTEPSKHDKVGINLQFVLQAAEICGTEALTYLCKNIMKERRRWNPGISYLIVYPDPIALLVTVSTSVAYNLLVRAKIASKGKSMAALMVTPQTVEPQVLKEIPLQTRMMLALHCYSTALATIASRDPGSVQAQLALWKKPLEQAIISLSLAQNGVLSVESRLKQLCSHSDWIVRLLAYEGLVVLADFASKTPEPDQLAALQDRDLRVRTAVAHVMASTGNLTYAPHILALADASDRKQCRAILPVIAVLASAGHKPSVTKLHELAEKVPDDMIRRDAGVILGNLKGSSEP